jgi:4,5-dihydroxyphthalate decarboxylase
METLKLRVALGKHDHLRALRDGAVRSDRIAFEFLEFDPIPKAFRQMIRSLDIDVSEMALTTQAIAHSFGKPITALPIPVWRRLHHDNLVTTAASEIGGPQDLVGKRVGVRAYSQTTGVWIRGILETEYGVAPERVTWVTKEDAHVAEYRDPPNVVRDDTASLRDLLFSGEVAAIMGERNVDPSGIRTVIPDAAAAGREWSKRAGVLPVNHIIAVRTALLDEHRWLAGELMRLFEAARQATPGGPDAQIVYGFEPNRAAIEMLLGFAARQGLTPRAYAPEELFPTV